MLPLVPATRLRALGELRRVWSPPKRGARRWKAGTQSLNSRLRGNERKRVNWADDEIEAVDCLRTPRTVRERGAAGTRAANFADCGAEPDHTAGAGEASHRDQSAAAALSPLRR